MRVLHCSDVHITGDYSAHSFWKLGWRRWVAMLELRFGGRARAYVNAREDLAAIGRSTLRHQADHLVLSGDLTAYALGEEFEGARTALEEWVKDPQRCTVIPGNHDRYTPGSRREKRFEKYFGHLLGSDLPEYQVEAQFPFVRLLGSDTAVVGLSSARAPTIPGCSFGMLGHVQEEALSALLRDSKLDGRAVFVVVHHAPLRHNGHKDRPHHGLWGAQRLLNLLPGPRFAVLHGHIHKRYHHPATDTRPHLFCAGSSTQAGHEGYWLIEAQGGQIRSWEKHPLSGATPPASG